jgi:hypothetical protein
MIQGQERMAGGEAKKCAEIRVTGRVVSYERIALIHEVEVAEMLMNEMGLRSVRTEGREKRRVTAARILQTESDQI